MRMRLKGDTSEITRPGTFVNIKLDGLPVGKWRYLSEMEVTMLKMSASAFKG